MLELLKVNPFKSSLNGTITLPGSKSITNRALIIGAIAKGKTTLTGALFSRDTNLMIKALNDLGFEIISNKKNRTIDIAGLGGKIPKKKCKIHVGNAGTVARFITSLLALQNNGEYEIVGDKEMEVRPIKGLLDALMSLYSVKFEFYKKKGFLPFKMHTAGTCEASAKVDSSASSQILSALLMTMQGSKKEISLKCYNARTPYINITKSMKSSFGIKAPLKNPNNTYHISREKYLSKNYLIEPDLSAASYFFALTAVNRGKIIIKNMPSDPIQGDAKFVNVLKMHGLKIEKKDSFWIVSHLNNIKLYPKPMVIDFNNFSDTFLTYAAISPLITKDIKIVGIKHTRHQETDRVAGVAKELIKLGQEVIEEEDSIQIISNQAKLISLAKKARNIGKTLEVETYNDHRFAMSFGILGTYDLLNDGKPWIGIKNPNCCEKTFPKFFNQIDKLRDGE